MSVDLKTTYLGLELATPLMASASPLGRSIEGLHRLERAGASALNSMSIRTRPVK